MRACVKYIYVFTAAEASTNRGLFVFLPSFHACHNITHNMCKHKPTTTCVYSSFLIYRVLIILGVFFSPTLKLSGCNLYIIYTEYGLLFYLSMLFIQHPVTNSVVAD